MVLAIWNSSTQKQQTKCSNFAVMHISGVTHYRRDSMPEKNLAPQVGLEPTTLRLTAECSAIELLRNVWIGARLTTRYAKTFIAKAVALGQLTAENEWLRRRPWCVRLVVPSSLPSADCYRYVHDYHRFWNGVTVKVATVFGIGFRAIGGPKSGFGKCFPLLVEAWIW